MRLLEIVLASPLAGAIGWTLLHSLWEGAIFSAFLAAVLIAIRSPRVRYAAACLALLAMLGGVGITLVRVFPEAAQSRQSLNTSGFQALNPGAGTDTPGSSQSNIATVVPWLALGWITGVWIFYLAQVAGWISLRRLRSRGVCAPPDRCRAIASRLGTQLRISRPVLLLESCLADVPMVLGHFRPVILIPVGMIAGLPVSQVEAILLHELAHVRRCDYLVNLLQRCVDGLLFYHPAAWWISRVIRSERENCCDDMVVAVNGNAHDYAVALATLEQIRWTAQDTAVAATGGNLVKRIRRLLYPERSAGAWAPFVAATLLVATAGLALAAWQADPPRRNPAPATKQEQAGQTSPYVKWLNEDVVYIITERERAAFRKLADDDERKMFIQQFWERRDPTPGTPENEFKEEHYRRISYANERFAGSKPGWKSERGRIYIQSGPPDEIESHPSGGGNVKGEKLTVPFEQWRYRYIEGMGKDVIFTFVDRARNGDYQLEPAAAR